MTETEDLKTRAEIIKDLQSPFKNALNAGGINEQFLIRKLKHEFENEEPKIIKVSGSVDTRKLPKGYKVISKPTKENPYGDTVIEQRVHNISISQKARMDAQKLLGLYPADKFEVTHIHESALEELLNEGK